MAAQNALPELMVTSAISSSGRGRTEGQEMTARTMAGEPTSIVNIGRGAGEQTDCVPGVYRGIKMQSFYAGVRG